MLTKWGIDLKSVVSLTTDGALSIIGSGRGLVGHLKEDHTDMLLYHCIIHQSVLCATLGEEYAEVMEKLMKLVNFLRVTSSR
ncbi:SCAN domain-containing protein 3-like 7 [Homarus americanus]|uniref:SCAN domain-containing protein 3-like 7 n=1 Tax=Homarus americanus TaxID=6706 RepID=A0A8J5JVE9_HOMAM|nr:SCAN domain-containing protein 3-like 7 [Homarus americanus]